MCFIVIDLLLLEFELYAIFNKRKPTAGVGCLEFVRGG